MNNEKLTIESAAERIEQYECLLAGIESPAWIPLSHARKEYGHALKSENKDYYLRIVARDLYHVSGY